MEIGLYFLVIYLIVFLIFFLVTYLFKLKRQTLGLNRAYQYIVKKYALNMDKSKTKKLSMILVIVNSLILSIPLTMVFFVEINRYFLLLISLVIFMLLFFSLYNIVGSILKKKGW